jgi:hypothetical protein
MAITPGYDFGVKEVPTFGKFMAQAQGLRISDLDFTDLTSDVTYVFNGQDSEGSGATLADQEGALWYSPLGDLMMSQRWTQANFGNTGMSAGSEEFVRVRLWRVNGGYETSKFRNGDASGDNGRKGAPCQVLSRPLASQYSPANIHMQARWINQLTTGARDVGYWGETRSSGTRGAVVMRGLVEQFLVSSVSGDAVLPFRVRSDSTTGWGLVRDDTTNARKWAIADYVLAHPSINPFTQDPQANDMFIMWAFGRSLNIV